MIVIILMNFRISTNYVHRIDLQSVSLWSSVCAYDRYQQGQYAHLVTESSYTDWFELRHAYANTQ